MLIGYCRVSTADQVLDGQLDALKAHGCEAIYQEHASGADKSRPELARALAAVGNGDTLVVVKLDRLARSVPHLCEVLEALRVRGASFHSLGDAIDTGTPTGMFTFHILGAVAQLERSLGQARTKAGLQAAKARGRIGGNPALRTPQGVAAMVALRKERAAAKRNAAGPCEPAAMAEAAD